MAFVVPGCPAPSLSYTTRPACRQRAWRAAVGRRRRCLLQVDLRASATGGSISRTPVPIGGIVVVERGRGHIDLARVLGVSTDGSTVDILVLKEFVKEMYIDGDDPPTYERIEDVRTVSSQYVPTQEGWIVLDADLATLKAEFDARRSSNQPNEPTVTVIAAEEKRNRPLSEEALKSQRAFPLPTKSQALVGAALSVPIAAWLYAGFAGARATYDANPMGEDLMLGAIRQTVLFSYAAGSVLCLVVGAGLFLFGLGAAAGKDNQP